jgi:hypothetical protein
MAAATVTASARASPKKLSWTIRVRIGGRISHHHDVAGRPGPEGLWALFRTSTPIHADREHPRSQCGRKSHDHFARTEGSFIGKDEAAALPPESPRRRAEFRLTPVIVTAEIVVGVLAGVVVVTRALARRPSVPRTQVTMGPGGWVNVKGGTVGVRPGSRPWRRLRPVIRTELQRRHRSGRGCSPPSRSSFSPFDPGPEQRCASRSISARIRSSIRTPVAPPMP